MPGSPCPHLVGRSNQRFASTASLLPAFPPTAPYVINV
jgi:hypothetical protein